MANIVISAALSFSVGLLQRMLTPDTVVRQQGSRLTNSQVTGASEGTAVPRIFGRFRVGGQMIWATTFREVINTTVTSSGGKGGPKQINESTEYIYFCSFAVGICEGEPGTVLQSVYLDGAQADLSKITYRYYDGSETQTADPKMVAVEGAANTPSYRGLTYIVFDELDLTDYGNRIPQVSVEVIRSVPDTHPTALSTRMRAVNIIPGSGEQIYATEIVTATSNNGESRVLNVNTINDAVTDIVVSLDNLQDQAPNVTSASLVVAWFGSSLDATVCTLKPKVDTRTLTTTPLVWSVAGQTRATADLVPLDTGGRPIYGGTASDESVRQAMKDIKRRGMRAVFYPFILMDAAGLPWRGKITGNGTNLMGTAVPANFTLVDETRTVTTTSGGGGPNGSGSTTTTTTQVPTGRKIVTYSGTVQWTIRRMILHYATLLKDILVAGDAFLISSEMVGLSQTWSGWGAALTSLMTAVRSILPAGVKVSYAADWSEYKLPQLTTVWNSADFIGIDNYLPITDWSDGDEIYTIDAFMDGIDSGEYWDYFYADAAARASGTRTPITGPQFRQKDIKYWAQNNHAGKPVWFTEFGCPAIDKGANQPNTFIDPKSIESSLPYRSNGDRNDAVQRLYLEAMLEYWRLDGFVDPANMFVWTWDARPYPSFPARRDVWGDASNWERGHWITGRLGVMTLARLIRIIMRDAGIPQTEYDVTDLEESGAQIVGFGIFELMSYRDALENLMKTYSFDVYETGDVFRFVLKSRPDVIEIELDDLIEKNGQTYTKSRRQDTDLPDRYKVNFRDEFRDYEAASVDGYSPTGYSSRVSTFESMCVLSQSYAKSLADELTQEEWTAKNTISFSLPMNYLRIENGDAFEFVVGSISRRYRVVSVTIGDQIDIEAVGYSEVVYDGKITVPDVPTITTPVVTYGIPLVIFAEVPVFDQNAANLWSPRLIASQRPWPGSVLVYEDDNAGGFAFNTVIGTPAIIGETANFLLPSVTGMFDNFNFLRVRLYDPADNLSQTTDLAVFNGANVMAIETPSGEWEIFQFANVTLETDGSFRLSRLIRGILGTDAFMASPWVPPGSRVFLYNIANTSTLAGTDGRLGIEASLRYGPGNIDVGDNRYTDVMVTPRGIAYRPLSPAHLKQLLVGDDIQLSWIRRTKFDADEWNAAEVPLHEEIERYRIRIYNDAGDTVLRTVVADSVSQIVYDLTMQVADFGVAKSQVMFGVAQYGTKFGNYGPERRFEMRSVS